MEVLLTAGRKGRPAMMDLPAATSGPYPNQRPFPSSPPRDAATPVPFSPPSKSDSTEAQALVPETPTSQPSSPADGPRTLRCGRYLLDLSRKTHIMGILNVTPDSFSDGGLFLDVDHAVEYARSMAEAGADIIDIGGESTRPGASAVTEAEEMERVIPVIEALAPDLNVPISIDTTKAAVARAAVQAGALMINDVTALHRDPEVAQIAASDGVPLVLMHMKGTPRTMQIDPTYDDLIGEITDYLRDATKVAEDAGVSRSQLVVDPGIGFGKTVEHNFELLRRLEAFGSLGLPILVGPSRKSFLGKTLRLPPGELVEATAAAVTAAILHGADIVRVHDVPAMSRVVRIADRIAGKGGLQEE